MLSRTVARARTQATSTTKASARQQQEVSAEMERALSVQSALEKEVEATARRISEKWGEYYELVKPNAKKAQLLFDKISSYGEAVATLRQANSEAKGYLPPARCTWEDELGTAFASAETDAHTHREHGCA